MLHVLYPLIFSNYSFINIYQHMHMRGILSSEKSLRFLTAYSIKKPGVPTETLGVYLETRDVQ
jgi:hypothetical protein